jgi:hypothetical protein
MTFLHNKRILCYMHAYVYISWVSEKTSAESHRDNSIYTQTYIYIFIYMYM